MSHSFKLWGWDKKPRTMLRFVKPGDILCFQVRDDSYGFGRILTDLPVGYMAEFFDVFRATPEIDADTILAAKRLQRPVLLDVYSLLDRKRHGDWRIIGHQHDFDAHQVENAFYQCGSGNSCVKLDIFDNRYPITEEERKTLPYTDIHSDYNIKELLGLL